MSLQPGTNSVEVAATAGGRDQRGHLHRDDLYVPGTVVLSAPPAPGGGNGPGTYAYPTATNSDGSPVFAPGLVPAERPHRDQLRLAPSRSRSGIANLQSTFGSLLGAQLIDLYIHAPSGSVPAGETQSTAAAGAWNYSIAPGGRVEPAHRGRRVRHRRLGDARRSATSGLSGSSSVGHPAGLGGAARADRVRRARPALVIDHRAHVGARHARARAGRSRSTLTGQDGFGTDDARTFTATPGGYTFGVCSAAVAGEPSPPAICSVNPAAVPFVMDTIPPASVNVQTELDPTVNPSGVALQGVTVPDPRRRGPRRRSAAGPTGHTGPPLPFPTQRAPNRAKHPGKAHRA